MTNEERIKEKIDKNAIATYLHYSAGVPVNQRRRVFSARFMGDDTRHAPRAWTTSPDFHGLNTELVAGAKMDHPLFPIIYQED